MMRSLAVCLFIAIVSGFHSDGPDRSFSPEVPRVYLHNIQGANVSFLENSKNFKDIEDPQALALAYVRQLVSPATFVVKDSYTTRHNGLRHVYFRQTVNDLEVFNADLNINIWKNKNILSVGSSFYKGSPPPPLTKPKLSSFLALHSLGKHLGHHFQVSDLKFTDYTKGHQHKHVISGFPKTVSDVKAKLAYLQVEMGQRLEVVWEFEVDVMDHWWNAHVSATSGEVLSLHDWVNDAAYNVYPIGTNDPSDGVRSVLQNPAVINASPYGWHDQGDGREFSNTIGNNVYAQENLSGGTSWLNNGRPEGGVSLIFNYPINFNQAPVNYLDASTSNLFFWNNIMHDVFWQYGFDEVSGNFQENNWGRGGLGNDAVQANCQDGSGTNNANFATPADGQRPRMRMYVWTRSNPYRDGDLDAGIVAHEYAHGISNRLTGGPSNVNCLGTGEAGGMGEGWGDFFATVLRQRPEYVSTDNFVMGDYDNNNAGVGIRKYPYTTDLSANPETYSYIQRSDYAGVHAKGEVWCGILWETYWNLVDAHGFAPNWYLGEGGNNQILQDVVDGMKIQPCRPTFVDARNAILQADEVNFGGRNICLLWRGFAKRGLGLLAAAGGTESFEVPAQCQ